MHRRAVRQALASPVPPVRKRPEGRLAPALGAYRALIDEWLVADRTAPRKQRHTARRIWRRLVDEQDKSVAVVLRQAVREHVEDAARSRGGRDGGEAHD